MSRSPHASAGLHSRRLAAHMQVRGCNQTVLQPTCSAGLHRFCHVREFKLPCPNTSRQTHKVSHAANTQVRVCIRLFLQPARKCRFATSLSCSPHASAGSHQRCLVAAHTHVRVCVHLVLQPARECRFATSLSCSPHASAGLHPRCLGAAHTHVRRFAAMLSCSPHTRAGLHSHVVCSPHACAGLHLHRLAACTRVQVCNPVVMQPTRKCGFASTLPCSSYIATTPFCSPHASAGLQPRCHAAHT